MKFQFNDGGRQEAGYKGYTGDCVCRAIAIATEKSYKEVYESLKELSKEERITKKRKKQSSVRDGCDRVTYDKYLKSLGWKWVPTMLIGQGCKVHLKEEELPKGKVITRLSKHLTCIIDGAINDTYDPSRDETRCVYGYYIKEK
jgi:hypothetical protein